MFSEFQCFFCMFFRHMHLFFLDSCTYPFYTPIHQFTKIYITFENLLWTILYSEEHTWEILSYWKRRVSWTLMLPPISSPGIMWIGSGHILKLSHCLLIHSWTRQTLTEGSAQPPEHRNVPSLAHPIAFGARFLNPGSRSPSEFEYLYFTTRRHPLGSICEMGLLLL
jgi:hypothetical protein